mgnify:CR=1 FL=1
MFVNIHTHVDNQAVIKIIDRFSEKILKTWGVHPWDVTNTTDCHFERNEVKSRNHRHLNDSEIFNDELFIGEVGLDKAHKDTFERQVEVFEGMIRLSESYRKPMRIHYS